MASKGYEFKSKDLKNLVLLPVAAEWIRFGAQLDIPKHTLNTIKVSKMGDPIGLQHCLGETLDWWLQNTSDPTYDNLNTALQNTENGDAVTKLAEMFASGTTFESKDYRQLVLLPIASDWMRVGLQLGIPQHTLNTFQASHMGNYNGPQHCLESALSWWLQNGSDRSYDKVKTALTNIQKGNAVKKLSEMFGTADLEARAAALKKKGDDETDSERPEGVVPSVFEAENPQPEPAPPLTSARPRREADTGILDDVVVVDQDQPDQPLLKNDENVSGGTEEEETPSPSGMDEPDPEFHATLSPNSLALVNTRANSVTVEWDPCENNPDYMVQYRRTIDTDKQWKTSDAKPEYKPPNNRKPAKQTAKISGLTANNSYAVRVLAKYQGTSTCYKSTPHPNIKTRSTVGGWICEHPYKFILIVFGIIAAFGVVVTVIAVPVDRA